MVNIKTLSFGPTLTRFRRLRYSFYHFFLPRGLALRMEMWELHRMYDRLLRDAVPGEDGDLFNEAAARRA